MGWWFATLRLAVDAFAEDAWKPAASTASAACTSFSGSIDWISASAAQTAAHVEIVGHDRQYRPLPGSGKSDLSPEASLSGILGGGVGMRVASGHRAARAGLGKGIGAGAEIMAAIVGSGECQRLPERMHGRCIAQLRTACGHLLRQDDREPLWQVRIVAPSG